MLGATLVDQVIDQLCGRKAEMIISLGITPESICLLSEYILTFAARMRKVE